MQSGDCLILRDWALFLKNGLCHTRARREYNVNLPHLRPDEPDPEVVFCPLDPHPLPLSYRHGGDGGLHYDGDYHARERTVGADVDVCFGGRIAVTQIKLL